MPLIVLEMRKLCLITVLGSIVLLGGCNSPHVERTSDKNKEGITTSLNSHFISVVPDSGKVRFISDGSLGIGSWGDSWQSDFSLGTGEKFRARPDHHASSSYEVRDINKNGVVLKYQTRFDHRSFGKNLISSDEGEVVIPYKRRK